MDLRERPRGGLVPDAPEKNTLVAQHDSSGGRSEESFSSASDYIVYTAVRVCVGVLSKKFDTEIERLLSNGTAFLTRRASRCGRRDQERP